MVNPLLILGAGSWGTALAVLLARNGYPVRLWGRNINLQAVQLSRCNGQYLPHIELPDSVEVMTDLPAALANVQDILIAVPSAAFRSILTAVHDIRSTDMRIAWATKGLDSENNQLLHASAFEIYGEDLPIAIIAGPSFAKEVAAGMPTAIVIASNNAEWQRDLTIRLSGSRLRVYAQSDLIGVQICGAVKNCLAIATGISDGLGYGANARAALIARGLVEMTQLGLAMGGRQQTFMGLAGIGDLILTCTDDQSRNRRFGLALGRGMDVASAEKTIGQVVEGNLNAFKVITLARQYQVEMPVLEQTCQVLEGTLSPGECVEKLFARKLTHE